MLIIYWEGVCPRCGSHKIRCNRWMNICEKCGYFETSAPVSSMVELPGKSLCLSNIGSGG